MSFIPPPLPLPFRRSALINSQRTAQTVGYAVVLIGFVFQSVLQTGYGCVCAEHRGVCVFVTRPQRTDRLTVERQHLPVGPQRANGKLPHSQMFFAHLLRCLPPRVCLTPSLQMLLMYPPFNFAKGFFDVSLKASPPQPLSSLSHTTTLPHMPLTTPAAPSHLSLAGNHHRRLQRR